jgi:hypothetical protein
VALKCVDVQEIYGVEAGHDLISRVTDAVLEDVKAWQARLLRDLAIERAEQSALASARRLVYLLCPLVA